MAISYDSNGNPQVDYVWGNMPLQGNTQRGVVAPVAKLTYSYQNDWDNVGGMFSIDLASATEVEAGWVITATAGAAGNTQITKEFTVESVSMGSPGYYVRTKEAFDPAFQAAGQSSPSSFVTSIAPRLNVGGGAGDKGWSKTTLVKSPLLDPTLDNHSLATSGWNGYPGYTPNFSVPPLVTLLELTTTENFAGSGYSYWFAERHQLDTTNSFYNGFNLTVSDPMGIGIEDLVSDWSALKTAIDTNTLSNASITINNWTSQYGTPDFNGVDGKLKVLGGWYYVDGYGNNVLTLSIVPTVPGDTFGLNDWYIFSGRMPAGVSIKITERSTAPALQFVQDDNYSQNGGSGDAVSSFMNWNNYDGRVQVYIGNGITPEQTTALTNGSLVGKTIGMGAFNQNTIMMDNNMWTANKFGSDVVTGVTGPFTDSYGATYYEIATDNGYAIQGIYAYRSGDTLVIL